ncbi:MAG: hypothetical protein HLX51_00585 [Micrococcaceae bacterium]|nr:hypothetical protein [Micrococcaceae bacterium]
MTTSNIATVDSQRQQLIDHPQREDRAIDALNSVLDYCQRLEDQGVQRIVTRQLRDIIDTSFDVEIETF